MPLYAPGIDANGGTITGNLSVTGDAAVSGVLSSTGILDINGGSDTATSAPAITPTLANNTAAQLADTTRDYMLYLEVGTAGTGFTLSIGPANTTVDAIVTSVTPVTGMLFTVRVPAGWFVKWAGTATTLASQIAIGC